VSWSVALCSCIECTVVNAWMLGVAFQPPKSFRKRFDPISLSISPFLVIDANTNQSKYIRAELI
jgi:hypothetical protein